MSKLMIFHNILPGCEEGKAEAWKAFLANYTPMAIQLLAVYSPWTPDARVDGWRDALRALSANEFEALRGFSHQSEREFLVDLRAFLQECAGAKFVSSPDVEDPPAPSIQTLGALLSGLPLLHQEIAFLTLAGYSPATLERVLRITPGVAVEGLERLRAGYARVLERREDRCLWPSAWMEICKAARADGREHCTPLRQLVRILDGQASWYDKSPAEEHRTKCLHCLELWTSLLEVVDLRRSRQPWTAEKLEPLLAAVAVKQGKSRPSFLARMLGN